MRPFVSISTRDSSSKSRNGSVESAPGVQVNCAELRIRYSRAGGARPLNYRHDGESLFQLGTNSLGIYRGTT